MRICGYLWAAFYVTWLLWGIRTKPTKSREPFSSWLSHTSLTVIAFLLLFAGPIPRGWLYMRIVPPVLWVNVLGIALTVAGLGFAIWARAYLGGNWSSAVKVKVGHELVCTGPYRWVRHPIYSGLILAVIGTAMNRGDLRGLLAVSAAYAGFKIKSRIEERFMTEVFGQDYDDYCRNTGAILPRFARLSF